MTFQQTLLFSFLPSFFLFFLHFLETGSHAIDHVLLKFTLDNPLASGLPSAMISVPSLVVLCGMCRSFSFFFSFFFNFI